MTGFFSPAVRRSEFSWSTFWLSTQEKNVLRDVDHAIKKAFGAPYLFEKVRADMKPRFSDSISLHPLFLISQNEIPEELKLSSPDDLKLKDPKFFNQFKHWLNRYFQLEKHVNDEEFRNTLAFCVHLWQKPEMISRVRRLVLTAREFHDNDLLQRFINEESWGNKFKDYCINMLNGTLIVNILIGLTLLYHGLFVFMPFAASCVLSCALVLAARKLAAYRKVTHLLDKCISEAIEKTNDNEAFRFFFETVQKVRPKEGLVDRSIQWLIHEKTPEYYLSKIQSSQSA